VHNSAHYSLNGCQTSQFENHWRAILEMPLGSTGTEPFFAMANLLGESTRKTEALKNSPLPEPFYLHWYGKSESRPGRKMGHINTWSSDPKKSQELLTQLRKVRDEWQKRHL